MKFNPSRQELDALFDQLEPEAQAMLIEFGRFLAMRASLSEDIAPSNPPPPPALRPDGENETVLHALRRLAASFPMLDRSELLHDAYPLVTAHTMEGKPAVEVIAELEQMFYLKYEKLSKQNPV